MSPGDLVVTVRSEAAAATGAAPVQTPAATAAAPVQSAQPPKTPPAGAGPGGPSVAKAPDAAPAPPASAAPAVSAAPAGTSAAAAKSSSLTVQRADLPLINEPGFSRAHAGPSVRMLARELGVDLTLVTGTGFKGRITHDDVKAFVKKTLSGSVPATAGAATGTRAACDPPRSILLNSERSRPSRCRGYRRSRAHACMRVGEYSARHAVRRCRHHRS